MCRLKPGIAGSGWKNERGDGAPGRISVMEGARIYGEFGGKARLAYAPFSVGGKPVARGTGARRLPHEKLPERGGAGQGEHQRRQPGQDCRGARRTAFRLAGLRGFAGAKRGVEGSGGTSGRRAGGPSPTEPAYRARHDPG